MNVKMTPEIVRLAYQLFLDRDAENEIVVAEKAEHCRNTMELRRAFVNSEEFKSTNPVFPTLSGHEGPILVDYFVSEEDLQRIFSRIQSGWTSLGEDDPYYSVLTTKKFWKKTMSKKKIEEFYESGKQEVDRLFSTLRRNSIERGKFEKCLDFGCGAGRISRWLSDEFEKVYAYDVAEKYLEMAQKYLDKQGIVNVEFTQVRSIRDIERFPKVDLIYSVIVLQHNPPPIIHRIILHFMKALNPRGIAFFQVPTYREGYRFIREEYLAIESPPDEMEMHVLPQSAIFDIVRKEGGKVLEVLEDFNTSWGLSNTFLIQKI